MMQGGPNPETQMGGLGREFPSTQWSVLLEKNRSESPAALTAVQALAGLYWKPVYWYVRSKWSRTNEDAKDLTQDFFIWMIEGDFLDRADPNRGRFRGFLKVALQHYLSNDLRAKRRQKRGGDRQLVSLEALADADFNWNPPDPAGKSPEEILDEAWKSELLTRAQEFLETAYTREEKGVYFQVFRDYFLSESEEVDYKSVAEKYSIQTSDVSNYLQDAKRRFRNILQDLLAETVEGPQELVEEHRALFGENQG